MGSCYIYQPQYLGAALSRTNGLPIGDAITGSRGRGRGAERRWGSGKVYFSCHAPPIPPAPTAQAAVLKAVVMECAPDFRSCPPTGRNLPESSARGHPTHPSASFPGQSFTSILSAFLD